MTLTPTSTTQQEQLARLQAALTNWAPDLIGTLVYPLRNHPDPAVSQQQQVLLIEKQRGHGSGLVNGAGGKLEPRETVLACAKRELQEEVGVQALQIELGARIRFVELQGPQWLGFVFVARRFSGDPSQSSEALPLWCNTQALPWQRMWPSDALWLPQVLAGKRLEVNLLFDGGQLLAKQLLQT